MAASPAAFLSGAKSAAMAACCLSSTARALLTRPLMGPRGFFPGMRRSSLICSRDAWICRMGLLLMGSASRRRALAFLTPEEVGRLASAGGTATPPATVPAIARDSMALRIQAAGPCGAGRGRRRWGERRVGRVQVGSWGGEGCWRGGGRWVPPCGRRTRDRHVMGAKGAAFATRPCRWAGGPSNGWLSSSTDRDCWGLRGPGGRRAADPPRPMSGSI